jgi:hypothetical protein
MTEMQHLLLLLQEHLRPLLLRRRRLKPQPHRLRPRLLVKVSFCIFSSSSVLLGFSVASECVCVCVSVSLCLCDSAVCICAVLVLASSCYAFRLGVTKKRVLLARAKSPDPANPNKRSVGTQNDLDHHHQSHDSDLRHRNLDIPSFSTIHSLSQPWN